MNPGPPSKPRLPRLLSWHSSTRKTSEARQRLADSELTTEYLEAGVRLIAAQFTESKHGLEDSGSEPDAPSPFFDWLSERKVIDEVNRTGRLRGSQGTFEDRWKYRNFYLEDLLTYALWAGHWADRVDVVQEAIRLRSSGADLVDAVRETAYRDIEAAMNSDNARLALIANAISDRYPEMKSAMRDIHRMMQDNWIPIYEAMLDQRGLTLRPGTTFQGFADILSALSMGISIVISFDPNKNLIDAERRRSLLGEATLALLAGCIDSGDGASVEDLVRTITGSPAPGPAEP